MALDEHQIPAVRVAGGVPEVVEADIIEGGAEAKLAMCPPSSEVMRLALITMASAFQRISERMRHSMPGPGYLLVDRDGAGSGVGAIGHVDAGGAGLVLQFAQEKWARCSPSASSTASRASSHLRFLGSRSL